MSLHITCLIKALLFLTFRLVLLLLLFSSLISPAVHGKNRQVHIAVTSDMHGWLSSDFLYPKRKKFGLAYLEPHFTRLRQKHPELIILDAGDLFSGSPHSLYLLQKKRPYERHPFLQLVEKIGYDAVTPGNHDLEFFPRFKTLYASHSSFPWLAANIRGEQRIFKPYVILKRFGLRIAVIGFTTPGVNMWVNPAQLKSIQIIDISKAAQDLSQKIQEEKPDLVIGLMHSGIKIKRNFYVSDLNKNPKDNAVIAMLRQSDYFDLIISGHDHKLSPSRTGGKIFYAHGTPIIQPGKWAENLLFVSLSLKEEKGRWEIEDIQVKILRAAATREKYQSDLAKMSEKNYQYFMNESTGWKYLKRDKKRSFCLHSMYAESSKNGRRINAVIPRLRFNPLGLKPGEYITRRHLFYWLPYENQMAETKLSIHDFKKIRENLSLKKELWIDSKANPPDSTNVGFFQFHEKNIPTVISSYHAAGGRGVLAKLLINKKNSVTFTSQALRDLFFEYLLKNNPPDVCSMFQKD